MKRQWLLLAAWALCVVGCAVRAFATGLLPPDPAAEPTLAPHLVELDRASVAELQVLPGIGPARAEAIVLARVRWGPFRSRADLEAIDGLGPTTIDALLPHAVFAAPDGGR